VKRLLAEWEKQDGILMTWPSKNTDWSENLKEVVFTYLTIIKEISYYEKVLLLTTDTVKISRLLMKNNVNLKNIIFAQVPYNDTWARDFGPITIKNGNYFTILDFSFNGWGLKFASNHDNLINRTLFEKGFFSNCELKTLNFVLEGGSIETNGKGILLATEKCLLSPNRNPEFSKEEIEKRLIDYFNLKEIIWLKNGFLLGDDTDSHIDTIVRFSSENTIIYVSPPKYKKDPHYEEFCLLEEELQNLKDRFELKPLPFAPTCFYKGKRLPATYANFLITNESVLMPTYHNKETDNLAKEVLKEAFPDREIIPIDSRSLIKQHGSIHCITMQLPQGILKQ